jgi:hypothetical protein
MNCEHTGLNGWWAADFDPKYQLNTIKIMKRTDCCGHRAFMTVSVGGTNCSVKTSNTTSVTYDCSNTTGSSINLQANSNEYVNFCGIEAEGVMKA